MTRSKWPLVAALFTITILLTGVGLWYMAVPPPLREPYDVRSLGLGSEATVVIALSTDCQSCVESMPFYQSLMAVPGVDGTTRKVIGVAMNGVAPMSEVTKAGGFKPHRLTSGPYMMRTLPGVSEPGTILLLDAEGNRLGRWTGRLDEGARSEIVAKLSRPAMNASGSMSR